MTHKAIYAVRCFVIRQPFNAYSESSAIEGIINNRDDMRCDILWLLEFQFNAESNDTRIFIYSMY
jgi:hypothetical protein